MDENIIVPTGSGGSNETRKVMSGWKSMQNGNTSTRQDRIIKEQQDRAQKIKNGQSLNEEDTGYRPGQDGASGEFSIKNAKKFIQNMNEQKKTEKVFKGNADQCLLKIGYLTGGVKSDTGATVQRGKILLVEEAGISQYKITYIPI